ncbi:MAG TPA: acyl carrier protein [Dongiaceae bacterium]|jgi:acyl carrier protein
MTNDEIRAVLRSHGRIPGDINSLPDDANLFAAGLTSLASVDVILALEEKFDIEFPDHMMHRKTFESVAAIASAITGLLEQKAEA